MADMVDFKRKIFSHEKIKGGNMFIIICHSSEQRNVSCCRFLCQWHKLGTITEVDQTFDFIYKLLM